MKAVRIGEPGRAAVTDVAEPKLRDPQDAIVRVTAAAICGADLFPLHGLTPGFEARRSLAAGFGAVTVSPGEAAVTHHRGVT